MLGMGKLLTFFLQCTIYHRTCTEFGRIIVVFYRYKRTQSNFVLYQSCFDWILVAREKINVRWFRRFFTGIKLHCKDKMSKIWNKYFQKRNIGVSVPISTFMCLWANYIFPRWVCRFCWRKYVDQSWEYINRSQTYECGNWGWGRAIPRKGIHKRNCRCSVGTYLLLGGFLTIYCKL